MKCFIVLIALFVLVGVNANVPKIIEERSSAGPLGIVSPTWRCGGLGTPIQLRISGCEGRCQLTPGTKYDCEEDFYPAAAAPSLSLRVQICMPLVGDCMTVIDTELIGSSVQPGILYTARYSVVPNDILSGQMVEFHGMIYHTDNGIQEVCVAAQIDII